MNITRPPFSPEAKGNYRILTKALLIAFMSLLLLIPIDSIEDTIRDRSHFRNQVIRDIAKSSTGAQTITGPIIVLPYEVTYTRIKIDPETKQEIEETYTRTKTEYFLPEELNFTGDITMEERYRGIYLAHIYQWKGGVQGSYKIPANYGINEDDNPIEWGTPYISFGITDTRGIIYKPELKFANNKINFEPGPKYSSLKSGLHAKLTDMAASDKNQTIPFSINFAIQGLQDLKIIPLGKTTSVNLKSNWPHPSFNGNQLPLERKINADGFSAYWQTTWFANNLGDEFRKSRSYENISEKLKNKAIGVKFIEGVDIYQKSERSAKYGFLFIGLTFAAFFLFEILKQLKIHPIQYGFVGLSLAMFFMLEFSLSEHMSFGLAYLIASTSSISILGYYIANALKRISWGIGFATLLGLLYAILYGLLISEDLALVLGSLTLFIILSLVMVFTKNIDWYQLTNLPAKPEAIDKEEVISETNK